MLGLGLNLARLICLVGSSGGASTNLRISPVDGNYRILGGVQWQWWNDDTGGFHGWFPTGPAGAIVSAWGAQDATASDADANALAFGADQDFRFVSPLLELRNPVTAGFHAPWVDGPDNALLLVWGVKDAAADPDAVAFSNAPVLGNFRMSSGGLLQLAHATSGKWHTVWGKGANGQVRESIGAGEV